MVTYTHGAPIYNVLAQMGGGRGPSSGFPSAVLHNYSNELMKGIVEVPKRFSQNQNVDKLPLMPTYWDCIEIMACQFESHEYDSLIAKK